MLHHWGQPDRLDTVLDTCIDQLKFETPERLLRNYPQSSATLAPMLHVAAALQELGSLQLSPTAKQRNRDRLKQAVVARGKCRAALFSPRLARTVTWAVLSLLVVGLGLSSVTVAAASALPNDRLYAWKRGSENVWLALQSSPERQAAISLGLAERRVSETELLYQRSGQVNAEVVAQLGQEYARTLSYIAAAPPTQASTLLQQLRTLGAQHEQQLTTLAHTASGHDQRQLLQAAASSEWAQQATPADSTTPPAQNQNNRSSTSSAPPAAQPDTQNSAAPTNQVSKPTDQQVTPDNARQPTPGTAQNEQQEPPGQDKPDKAPKPEPPGQAKQPSNSGQTPAKPDQPPGQTKPDKVSKPEPPDQAKQPAKPDEPPDQAKQPAKPEQASPSTEGSVQVGQPQPPQLAASPEPTGVPVVVGPVEPVRPTDAAKNEGNGPPADPGNHGNGPPDKEQGNNGPPAKDEKNNGKPEAEIEQPLPTPEVELEQPEQKEKPKEDQGGQGGKKP